MIEKSASALELQKKKLLIQNSIESASKDADNPYFESKYADLCEVVSTIKEAMIKAEAPLLIEQYPQVEYIEGKPVVSLQTIITDVDSGEFEKITINSQPTQDTPQAIGSVITYLRRYTLMPIFGVVPADDDGNSGSNNQQSSNKQSSQNTKRPPSNTKTQQQKTATVLPEKQCAELRTAVVEADIDIIVWRKWLLEVWKVQEIKELIPEKAKTVLMIIKTKPTTIKEYGGTK